VIESPRQTIILPGEPRFGTLRWQARRRNQRRRGRALRTLELYGPARLSVAPRRTSREISDGLDAAGIGIASGTYEIVGMPPLRVEIGRPAAV
jgi:hypothetical protein